MTDETETNTEEQEAENHDSRGNVSTRNVPAIEELPNGLKKTLNDKQGIIRQRRSPLYTNGRASRTAMTSLMMT